MNTKTSEHIEFSNCPTCNHFPTQFIARDGGTTYRAHELRESDGGGEVKFTTGHCENHKQPGGCQLHNLQCGYPKCDQRPIAAAPPAAVPTHGGRSMTLRECMEAEEPGPHMIGADLSPPPLADSSVAALLGKWRGQVEKDDGSYAYIEGVKLCLRELQAALRSAAPVASGHVEDEVFSTDRVTLLTPAAVSAAPANTEGDWSVFVESSACAGRDKPAAVSAAPGVVTDDMRDAIHAEMGVERTPNAGLSAWVEKTITLTAAALTAPSPINGEQK